MTQPALHLPEGWEAIDLPVLQEAAPPQPLLASELHVAIAPDAAFKIGTCAHCVLFEEGRPARAWDADGDTELDFDRTRYFTLLARFGLVMHDRQAYVCP
jgi:hypothetical protein